MTRSLFGSILKRAPSRYYGRYRRSGKDYYTPTFTTKSEVRRYLNEIHASITRGEWNPTPTRAYTYQQWTDHWLNQQAKEGKSPNTIRARRSHVRRHLNPIIGHKPLTDITSNDVEAIRAAASRDVSQGTVRNIMLALSASLTAATRAGHIDHNPVADTPGAFTLPHRPQRPRVTLDADSLDLIISQAPAQLRAAFLAASYGALRYGEVAGLHTSDIDPQAHAITVNGSVARAPDGGLVYGAAKTRAAYRTVTLPARLWHHMDTHLRFHVAKDGRLFHDPRTASGYYSNAKLNKHLKETATALNINPQPRMHDLRHSGLTLYGQTGATLADLMARAGHTDAKTVMIYQHSSRDRDRDLTERM